MAPLASGTHLRLDRGHSRPETRRTARRELGLDRSDSPACSILVPSPAATVLAAMLGLVLGPEPDGPSSGGWATIGGRAAVDPVGVVEWRRRGSSRSIPGDDLEFVLLHHDANMVMPSDRLGDSRRVVERYSLQTGADWWAGDLRGEAGCYRFRAYHRGAYRAEVRLRVPGACHVRPALAALAVGCRLNVPVASVRERLEGFGGVPRMFEDRGTYRGARLIDDAAAGRGGVAHALGLAREVFGPKPIRVAYRVDGRLDARDGPTGREFGAADQVFLVPGGEVAAESTRLLAASLRSSGTPVVCCPSLDMATRELDRYLEPGDVLLTLGAREVGTITDAFLRRLCRHPHDRRTARPADLVPPGWAGGVPRPPA